jgi:arylsulfatase A-like enzyme
MLSAMDDGVGMVMAKLRECGLEENTLIFFVSDNGGPTATTTSSNFPLSGFKGQLWEGGMREPFIIQWKGHIPAGQVFTNPVSTLDFLPTALAVAGSPSNPKLEGVNLLPYLTGEKTGAPNPMLCWRINGQRAIRVGDWKLLDMAQGQGWKLFNLASDIAEKNDLREKEPAKAAELEAAFKAWDAKNVPAKWMFTGAATEYGRKTLSQGLLMDNELDEPPSKNQ